MIDVAVEEVFSLTEAAKRLPQRRKGARPHVATLHRWCQTGIRGIRLESICIGGCRCTSAPALQRFFEGVTLASEPQPVPVPQHSATRRKQIEQAERRLAKAGI
jgi:hypothetical protein